VPEEQMETPKSKVPSSGVPQTKMDTRLGPPIVVVVPHQQGVYPRPTETAVSPGSKLNIIVSSSIIVRYKLGHSPFPKGFNSLNGVAWGKPEQTGEFLDHRALQAGTLTFSKGRHPRRVAMIEALELTRSLGLIRSLGLTRS
jgi:hypothetical protein